MNDDLDGLSPTDAASETAMEAPRVGDFTAPPPHHIKPDGSHSRHPAQGRLL
ncbi:hypothetical protein AB0D35_31365 [Streptomyces sp. NPDC048301]|uniref:hypothetical protein n=1 Tax=Streptomyces sp. NPDC048301 TaxID=3155631 RepID=UPI00342D33BA